MIIVLGKVRGLICRYCNAALGYFEDNIGYIDSAISYLNSSPVIGPNDLEKDRDKLTNKKSRRYSLSEQQISRLYEESGNICSICKKEYVPTTKYPDLIIDHCHDTGAIRGLLCGNCNLGLGHSKDDVSKLNKLKEYLTRPPITSKLKSSFTVLKNSRIKVPGSELDTVHFLDPLEWDIDTLMDKGMKHSEATKAVLNLQKKSYPKFSMILWNDEKDIPAVKNMIAHKSGENPSGRVYARKCSVVEVNRDTAKDFYSLNHLQGPANSFGITYGLQYSGSLVACMSFNVPDVCRGVQADHLLQRYATSLSVVGGASKLLKFFQRSHEGTIVSYSDNRYSNGNLYRVLGFDILKSYKPDYRYFRDQRWFSKSSKQKKNLRKEISERKLNTLCTTEFDMARDLGYRRVYDCGKITWILI